MFPFVTLLFPRVCGFRCSSRGVLHGTSLQNWFGFVSLVAVALMLFLPRLVLLLVCSFALSCLKSFHVARVGGGDGILDPLSFLS